MSDFADKLRLKEAAEEDLYFAKQDRKLIQALREKKLAQVAKCADGKQKGKAADFEERFEEISEKHQRKPRKLLSAYRGLLADIKKACGRGN
jgi:hypothetical protein